MKIENSGLTPITPKKTESTQRIEKKRYESEAASSAPVERDNAVVSVSGNARTLAKARVALENSNSLDVESEKVTQIRQQIESGTYTIQSEEIAKRLMAGIFANYS